MIQIKTFICNPFSENTYVLSDTQKNAIVFDPGCYTPQERATLKKYIDDNGLIVRKLINTHCHLDHIFGNSFIADTYHVDLECHKNEVTVLQRAHIAGDLFGVPIPPQPELPPNYHAFIEDGDTIDVGDIHIKAILAPGHSPGSLCFYAEKEKFLIGGDVLFYGSIGRTDLPGGNYEQLIKSIKTRILTLPDDVKVYSGHGPVTMIGFEKQHNSFLQ